MGWEIWVVVVIVVIASLVHERQADQPEDPHPYERKRPWGT